MWRRNVSRRSHWRHVLHHEAALGDHGRVLGLLPSTRLDARRRRRPWGSGRCSCLVNRSIRFGPTWSNLSWRASWVKREGVDRTSESELRRRPESSRHHRLCARLAGSGGRSPHPPGPTGGRAGSGLGPLQAGPRDVGGAYGNRGARGVSVWNSPDGDEITTKWVTGKRISGDGRDLCRSRRNY